eukprot:364552-Chlamydomonas_euryale.AAC.6
MGGTLRTAAGIGWTGMSICAIGAASMVPRLRTWQRHASLVSQVPSDMRGHAMPSHARSCHARSCHAMPSQATPCHAMPSHVVPC